jgi:hypothetical protein
MLDDFTVEPSKRLVTILGREPLQDPAMPLPRIRAPDGLEAVGGEIG